MSETVETTLENLDTALAGETPMVAEATPVEPKIDAQGRAYATGKRKNAIARV
jgi:small subunit ribosomal protein S9